MKKVRQHGSERRGKVGAQYALAAEPQLVRIEKPVYGGAFLGRVEGKAIFTPLTLPGELVRARVVADKRSYVQAEAEEIVECSPERIEPVCRHFGVCGGCHYQHTGYEQQIEFKKAILRETLERGGSAFAGEIDVLAAAPWAYRNRIRLAADAAGNLGYRSRRSHAIVPIAECPIAAPLLVHGALTFAALAKKANLACDEIALFCNADETELLGSVTVHGSAEKQLLKLTAEWVEQVSELTGVLFEQQTLSGRSPQIIAQWGKHSLTYVAAGMNYHVNQRAFFQINRWLVDELVAHVTAGLAGETAWDLYAGVGLFAQRLVQSFGHVRAVESAPGATASLVHNLEGTGGEAIAANTLHFLQQNATDTPDAIVVDPPRTGLGPEITALLGRIGASSLTYVSCDPATLARDLKALSAFGYRLDSVTLADLFPQTFHIETIVRMRHL